MHDVDLRRRHTRFSCENINFRSSVVPSGVEDSIVS
jgi:hypothetical protein